MVGQWVGLMAVLKVEPLVWSMAAAMGEKMAAWMVEQKAATMVEMMVAWKV